MSSTLRLPHSKTKARHIGGGQFQFGRDQVKLRPGRFADLFCNCRAKRVREWLDVEPSVPPWVLALLAAMQLPKGRARVIATTEHLIATAAALGST